ncbi:MAG TPA: polysaccharide deacetylase family protein [Bacteroidales bacterium]|nr:polysaccharide deacetylase family protein [Bacteroidales bacterium]
MLTFKNTLLIAFVMAVITGVLTFLFGLSLWWLVLPVALLASGIVLGTFNIGWSFYFDVIDRIHTNNSVVLTFDDGPDEAVTPKILEVLRKNNVQAVFFVIGHKAERFPSLVKQLFDEGHIIGNHSYRHHNFFGFWSSQKVADDIAKAGETIKKIIGVTPHFFRPPFGVTNPNIKNAVKKLNLSPVGWSLRSLDTTSKNVGKITKRVSKVKAGDIVLFHDRIAGEDEVIENFILTCRQKNLAFARLDEALEINAYD